MITVVSRRGMGWWSGKGVKGRDQGGGVDAGIEQLKLLTR